MRTFFRRRFLGRATRRLGVWALLTLGAVPQLVRVLKVYNQPKPSEAPPNFPIWPLWYVAWAFLLTRSAGGLLVVALILDAIWPIHLGS